MTAAEVAALFGWSREELAVLGLSPLDVIRARYWIRHGGSGDAYDYQVSVAERRRR